MQASVSGRFGQVKEKPNAMEKHWLLHTIASKSIVFSFSTTFFFAYLKSVKDIANLDDYIL